MNVTIVDYNSGNISSVINSFKEVAKDKVNIEVTSDLNKIKSSDKIVLPGQGSFKSCVDALNSVNGLVETLNEFAIDVSNRPYLIWKVKLKVEKLGEMDTELFKEWFQAFSQSAGITLHIENIYGDNSHHIIESCFKALARSLRTALEIDPRNKKSIPSTKGSL